MCTVSAVFPQQPKALLTFDTVSRTEGNFCSGFHVPSLRSIDGITQMLSPPASTIVTMPNALLFDSIYIHSIETMSNISECLHMATYPEFI